ncbi:MAG: Gfo/Idh/MocA family oxidoreductase [Gemmatimonadota bacterium]|nr:Gfo/Idh/MocA family oxidoreductase [Gemmatimonadota bacterium]
MTSSRGVKCRIGIIGCGRIVQAVHLEILAGLPGVRVVALAEPDPHRLEAARLRVPSSIGCLDYAELLDLSDVDAVVVCGPSAMHAAAAVAALERGKHVYLEKPIATTLEDGRQLLDAYRRSGLVGMVGFNYRFNPLHEAARRHFASGRTGDLVAARSVFTTSGEIPAWKLSRQSGGGVLLDLASHHVDMMRFLFGKEITEVQAMVQSRHSEADTAQMSFLLERDIPAHSLFSFGAAEEDRFDVYGSRGRMTFDRHRSTHVAISGRSNFANLFGRLRDEVGTLGRIPFFLRKLRAAAYEPSFRSALTHFVAAVSARKPAVPDIEDGYRSLSVILAAEESARSGRAIAIRDMESGSLPHRVNVVS